MLIIAVRGASGVVAWTRMPIDRQSYQWICGREQFVIAGPATPVGAEASAVALIQHSATHVGAVSQVVELDL